MVLAQARSFYEDCKALCHLEFETFVEIVLEMEILKCCRTIRVQPLHPRSKLGPSLDRNMMTTLLISFINHKTTDISQSAVMAPVIWTCGPQTIVWPVNRVCGAEAILAAGPRGLIINEREREREGIFWT